MRITPERVARIGEVAARRQLDLTIILENVHDPHNIGAVLRSCDAVGVREIFVLYTEPQLTEERLKVGKRTSAGARKWVDIHYYRDVQACFELVRSRYQRILSAMPSDEAMGLWALDLLQPTALLLGNERDGISPAARALCDGDFVIPMAGMARSLNISVACAVSLYEAFRQRQVAGYYDRQPSPEHELLLGNYLERHNRTRGKIIRAARDPQ
jgi:tRNA (guanosine-2'-O-)-methyltransferase